MEPLAGDEFSMDDPGELEPRDASTLSQDHMHSELQRYGLQATGHHAHNVAMIQDQYDDEFQKVQAGRNEFMEQRKKLDAARRKRAMYEAQHVEEMEDLARNPKLEVWYNLAQDNQTPQDAWLHDLNGVTCRAVARVLKQNTSLLSLDLSQCNLGDEAGVHLAEMLRTNRRLLKLEAERNNFGPATARGMGQALSVNNTLVYLSLECNPMTVVDGRDNGRENDFSGIESLAEMLEKNTSLTTLNLFKCNLGLDGGRALKKFLAKNSSLVVLDVGDNGVGVQELGDISEMLEKNKQQRELSDRIRREQRKESQRVAEERRKQHEAERKAREQDEWHHEQARLREEARQKAKEDEYNAKIEAERKRKEEEERQKAEEARKAAEDAAKKKKKKGKKKKK